MARAGRPAPALRVGGFTLVELLIALVLLSLILMILYSALRVGARSWDSAAVRAQESDQRQLVLGLLRRELGQARSLYVHDEEKGRVLAFRGEADAIELVAPFMPHLPLGGLYHVRFEQAEDGEGTALTLSYRPYVPVPGDEEPEAEERVLVSGLMSVGFGYFGASQVGEQPEWHDEWEAPHLPQLVRVTIDAPGGSWPVLTVAVQ